MNNSVALNPSASPVARAAITLLELTFALAITAIVVFAAMRGYSQSRENSRFQQASNEIGIVRAAIASRFGMNSDFATLDNSLIKPSMPASLIDDAMTPHTFANAFKGQLDVGPDQVGSASGDSFYISLTGLTSEACNRLIRTDLGRDAVYIKVSNGSVPGAVAKDTALPLSDSALSAAATKCSAATLNTVAFQFSSTGQSSGGSGGSGGGSSVPAGLGTVAGYSGSAQMFGATMLNATQAAALVAANTSDPYLGMNWTGLNNFAYSLSRPHTAADLQSMYDDAVGSTLGVLQHIAANVGIDPNATWTPTQLATLVSVYENYILPNSMAAVVPSPNGVLTASEQKWLTSAIEQGALNYAKNVNPPGSPVTWVGTNIVNNNILQDPTVFPP